MELNQVEATNQAKMKWKTQTAKAPRRPRDFWGLALKEAQMKIERILNIVQNVKQICKNYVVLIEIGSFYYCYGKDTFIINYLEKYKIKILENNIYSCSFPKSTYNKVITQLEGKKINYIVLDRRNNYEEQEKSNFKNLNSYEKYYELGKAENASKIRIEKITNYLNTHSKDKELINNIERLINERRKI